MERNIYLNDGMEISLYLGFLAMLDPIHILTGSAIFFAAGYNGDCLTKPS